MWKQNDNIPPETIFLTAWSWWHFNAFSKANSTPTKDCGQCLAINDSNGPLEFSLTIKEYHCKCFIAKNQVVTY